MSKLLHVFVLMLFCVSAHAGTKCINVFYDKSDDPTYWMGKTYSILVQNLLGHFPEYQQIITPIESYQAGDIEKCRASIYIASYFNNSVPDTFYKDYVTTTKNVAWLGYKIWNLGDDFEKIFGFTYSGLSHLDYQSLDKNKQPSYFKDILYKGEVFSKYGGWSKDTPGVYLAPFEQTLLTETVPGRAEIIASARHTQTGEIVPYILRAKNHFYVTEVPLSFIHEADRYFVFSDLLFDILGESPRHNGKYALLRIEDVHSLIPLPWLYKITDLLQSEKVPLNISLIPIFYDPLFQFTRTPFQTYLTMDRYPPFMSFLNEIQKRPDTSVIWHGVTHQYGKVANPHTGTSGDDFEFFDANKNSPIREDSTDYVLNKLEDGNEVMNAANVKSLAWLMPHYQASPLDYLIFARVFPWNIGRVIYYNVAFDRVPKDNPALLMSSTQGNAAALRRQAFKDMNVRPLGGSWTGQMFPYEIYGDIYGQKLIPENLGNSQPFVNEHVTVPRSKEEIVADAKRNLVLRDAWASFFYHPFLVTTYEEGGRGRFPGDPAELQFIIQELKKLGYRFIDLNDYINQNTTSKRPEPIYKD